jgi:hypothetical protein
MKKFKDLLLAIVSIISLGGAIWLIITVPSMSNPTPRETTCLNVILFVLSCVSAVIIGYYFSRFSTSEKIDTIATASTEKMVHLSLQLQHLSDYLSETEATAQDEMSLSIHAETGAYRHRIVAAADMAASLAASNETFRNDWLGVASDSTRQIIEAKYENLREYLQDAETYERLQVQRSSGDTSPEEERLYEKQIQEVQKRIEDARRHLPMQPVVARSITKSPAVEANQEIETSSESQQAGLLKVRILRPVFNATGSGRLTPYMSSVPHIEVKLIGHPQGLNTEGMKIAPGTGTVYDFNVSIRSTIYGAHLPVGEYIFEYTANTKSLEPETVSEEAG